MGDERDRRKQNEEPDVEAHRTRLHPDEAEKVEDEGTDDDTPDVEAHRTR